MQSLQPTPAATAAAGHKNYQLTDLGPISLQNHRAQTKWALGDTMQFDWCPYVSESNNSTQPVAEVLTATLQGPYPSFAAAGAARPAPGGVPSKPQKLSPSVYGPVVASAAPIHTNTWAGVEEISSVHLSTRLAPGYYLFVLNILSQPGELSEGSGDSGIVEITG